MAMSGYGVTVEIDGQSIDITEWSMTDDIDRNKFGISTSEVVRIWKSLRETRSCVAEVIISPDFLAVFRRIGRHSRRHDHPRAEHRRQRKIAKRRSK